MNPTLKGIRTESGKVILRQVQVDESLHSTEGRLLHLHDLAALQMERHHLSDTREAVAGDVVEVVATQVEQARVRREAARDSGVASVLTRGVLRHHLKGSQMLQFCYISEDFCL